MKITYRAGLAAAFVIVASGSQAHEGDLVLRAGFEQAGAHPLEVRSPLADRAVALLVEHAATVRGTLDRELLPAETWVERVAWDGDVLDVYLTIPADSTWQLSAYDTETLSGALTTPFVADPHFAGIEVYVRRGEAGSYGSLQDFVEQPPAPPEQRNADAEALAALTTLVPGTPLDVPPAAGLDPAGSPTAAAAGQPSGALSGVTVYISGGHGWTAQTNWVLQRPILLGMCEDYGNIDQLNYMAHFLFNAGATVVPLRPVGWQPIEVILDQDDPGVTYSGAWSDSFNATYYENGVTNSGVSYRFTTAAGVQSATARFTPTLPQSGHYPVYGYAIASDNRVRQLYRIQHSGGQSEVRVDHRNVGNGWVWLGEYYFDATEDNWVEVSNAAAEAGAVLADAIRWGGGQGDVVRPGPGTISGFPRDEEGQRYWAESEWGNNAVGFSSTIWDGGSDDLSDNVGAGARMAREMNLTPAGGVTVDRWKRVHLEFHTNAFDSNSRGQITLITNTGSTTNQTSFATILSNEVDADLLIADSEFEHTWIDRVSPTLTGAYGAISTSNNSNEFDATLVELAFHDNSTDAELLRDPRVRRAMARACVHGIIRFLNTLPGSTVPLAFAPDTPGNFRVIDLGGSDVQLAWTTPTVDGARGDAATGFVIYQSSNGLGFGNPIVLGNVGSHVISGVPAGETRYYRIAARNAGGESQPSEVLAVRKPSGATPPVLIVNGFDRLRRQNNPTQALPGGTIERQIWRASNSFDYVIEHAEALAAAGYGFDSTSNDTVINSLISLTDYELVDWILGTESSQDQTFTLGEQNKVTTFLNGGGSIFVSGADVGFDLVGQGAGASFATGSLRFNYSANDANTYNIATPGSGIFSGLAAFSFSQASGAPYDVREPDVLTLPSGAVSALSYSGGLGGVAATQYTGVYNTVVFGFPFEAIGDPAVRDDVMQRVMTFLETAAGPLAFDANNDGDVDFSDVNTFLFCLKGPDVDYATGPCLRQDGDGDFDVDAHDIALLQQQFTGPL